MRSRLWMSAVVVAAMAALAGCGDDQTATDPSTAPSTRASSAPASSPSAPKSSAKPASNLPACATTWVPGKRLPAKYRGCQEHGVEAHSLIFRCEIGSRLATYGPDLYAVPGRPVVKAVPSRAKDKDWKFAYNHCVG